MKKLMKIEINDGLDGIIVAKSLKQAVKMIIPYYGGYEASSIMSEIKKSQKHPYDPSYSFSVTDITHVAKKKKNRRPRIAGWYE